MYFRAFTPKGHPPNAPDMTTWAHRTTPRAGLTPAGSMLLRAAKQSTTNKVFWNRHAGLSLVAHGFGPGAGARRLNISGGGQGESPPRLPQIPAPTGRGEDDLRHRHGLARPAGARIADGSLDRRAVIRDDPQRLLRALCLRPLRRRERALLSEVQNSLRVIGTAVTARARATVAGASGPGRPPDRRLRADRCSRLVPVIGDEPDHGLIVDLVERSVPGADHGEVPRRVQADDLGGLA